MVSSKEPRDIEGNYKVLEGGSMKGEVYGTISFIGKNNLTQKD